MRYQISSNQLKSSVCNQWLHTIQKAHFTTRHVSNNNTNCEQRTQQSSHGMSHGLHYTGIRAPPLPPGGGGRCYGGQPLGAVGVTEGWAPHGIRRWGSRRSLGTRSSSLRCTTCQQAQRLTGLNCLPLCVAVLGAPHVIYDHAAAAAPVAAELCTSVALCSPNHGYPADHWGACNRDSRSCHDA